MSDKSLSERFTLEDAFNLCLRTKGLMTGTGQFTKQQVWQMKNSATTVEQKRKVIEVCGFKRVQTEMYVATKQLNAAKKA